MSQNLLLGVTLCLSMMILSSSAYNDDRPIYKWSPLWFSRYFRNSQMYKRDPSAGGIEVPDRCIPEHQRCSYWGVEVPCCEPAECIMDHCVPPQDMYAYNHEA